MDLAAGDVGWELSAEPVDVDLFVLEDSLSLDVEELELPIGVSANPQRVVVEALVVDQKAELLLVVDEAQHAGTVGKVGFG